MSAVDLTPRSYSLTQASALLQVSVDTLRRLEQRGQLRTVRFPGVRRCLVPASEIARILEGRLEETETSLRLVRGGKTTAEGSDPSAASKATAG